jgi:hypothetical protein
LLRNCFINNGWPVGRDSEASGGPLKKQLVVLSQKVARFDFENQVFEKIQDWRTRC